MASNFFLKNLPERRSLDELARRYPDFQISASEPYIRLLRLASDILARVEARMADQGLSQGKFCVLMQLHIGPEAGLTPSELAEKTGVTRATVTGLLDGLEREGFITRERALKDRRSQAVRLTPKSRRGLEAMLPGHFRRTGRLMAGLGEAERRTLTALLSKIEAALPDYDKE